MCGRYYIADDDSDVMLAGYVAQAQRRADAMNLSLVTCHLSQSARCVQRILLRLSPPARRIASPMLFQ